MCMNQINNNDMEVKVPDVNFNHLILMKGMLNKIYRAQHKDKY